MAAALVIAGFKVAAIITSVPEPPLPALLTGIGSSSGSTNGCSADIREQNDKLPLAWSPELNRRLGQDFPPGTDVTIFERKLQQLGFKNLGACSNDPTIRSAFFRQHGGFALRPGGLPMGATIWWKLDPGEQRLVWARGMVAFDVL